jgi:small subunit ribosomal protein S5
MTTFEKETQKRQANKVVEIRRVCKVGKGGKKLSFRAIVVVGDQNGLVGIGIGKANEVINAIKKGKNQASNNMIQIPLTKTKTIPHLVNGFYGAANVVLRPAAPGSGVIAGSSIRTVLELAGIKNILAKQIRSNNLLNNAQATIYALKTLKYLNTTAKERELQLEKLAKKNSSKANSSNHEKIN